MTMCGRHHLRDGRVPEGTSETEKRVSKMVVYNVLPLCEYIVAMAPPAYQGRVGMPTGPPSRVDAWGGAWEAVWKTSRVDHAYGSKKGICLGVKVADLAG